MVTENAVPVEFSTYSVVVADGADAKEIANIQGIQDVTTNPSLIVSAVCSLLYEDVVKDVSEWAKYLNIDASEKLGYVTDYLTVCIGSRILNLVPGRVSTEVDPRLAFDTEGTLLRARRLIDMYTGLGVSKDRVLIKVPATWEGICAAELLEKEGIHCNLTLIFNMSQARACAAAKVTLISPFVGRISEWYKNHPQVTPKTGISHEDSDPGVDFVISVYNYFKKFGFKTAVMAASFRQLKQILSLCGCDLITIGLPFLKELMITDKNSIHPRLSIKKAREVEIMELAPVTQKDFQESLEQDPMAKELLINGIERFVKDTMVLETFIKDHAAFA